MKRVLLLAVAVCSVLVSGGVASAQTVPPDLGIYGYVGDSSLRIERHTRADIRFSINNSGGSDAQFSSGDVLATASWNGSYIAQSCDVDPRSNLPAETVECAFSQGTAKFVVIRDFSLSRSSGLGLLIEGTTLDDGKVEIEGTVDPRNDIVETSDSNNKTKSDQYYVGTVPPTDLSVSRKITVNHGDFHKTNEVYTSDEFIFEKVTIKNTGADTAFDVDIRVPDFPGFRTRSMYVYKPDGTYSRCELFVGYGGQCFVEVIYPGTSATVSADFYREGEPILGEFTNAITAAASTGDSDESNNVDSLKYTLRKPPVRPKISSIARVETKVNKSVKPINFTVFDADAPARNLKLTVRSSNPKVLPNAKITVAGTGENRALKVVPTRDRIGSARITVTAIDKDGLQATRTFSVSVKK